MIATWVPARLTPLSFAEASGSMRLALAVSLGKEPPREVLALALAKTALETGHWKSMYCNNWGNIKASSTYVGAYCTIALNEVIGDKVVWFSPRGRLDRKGGVVVAEPYDDPPGHPQTRMRAYASATEGAAAYVKFVEGGRYAAAWQRLLAGDAVGYVTLLRQAGYFTAPLDTYVRGVVDLQRQFLIKLTPPAPPPPPVQSTPSLMPTLRRGARGPDVARLQEALNAHGALPSVKVDEDFGEKTYLSLRSFQQRNKLIADGVAGPRTWAALLATTPSPPNAA